MDLTGDIVKGHIRYANECLIVAQAAIAGGNFRSSVNRSYYCVFNCVQALLAAEGISYKKHSAVIGHFRKNYIHSKIFDVKLSDIISELFDERNDCDYDMDHYTDEDAARAKMEDAVYFLEEVERYIAEKG